MRVWCRVGDAGAGILARSGVSVSRRCGVCVHVCLCISIVRGMCSSGINALSNLITTNTIHFAFVNFVNTLT